MKWGSGGLETLPRLRGFGVYADGAAKRTEGVASLKPPVTQPYCGHCVWPHKGLRRRV